MTDDPPEAVPPQPLPLARAAALQLVTRHRLRLADQRDSRFGELAGAYDLCVAGWTGPAAVFVGFYTPPADQQRAAEDLGWRLAAAARWGAQRLSVQGAQRCDVLLVPMAEVPAMPPPNAHPAVHIGAVWADPARGDAQQVVPAPRGLPGSRELRSVARAIRDGAEAPTLAAVDLAERETVRGGYVAPVRRQMISSPTTTFALIGAFIAVYFLEYALEQRYGRTALLGMGELSAHCTAAVPCAGYTGDDWFRYLSTAFLHQPSGIISLHLIMNCFSMLNVGRIVEQLYGRLVLVGVFLATAVAGSAASVLGATAGLPSAYPGGIGASGGICGLLGLLLVLGRVQGKQVPAALSSQLRQSVLVSAAITLFIGVSLSGVINNYAHAGGFITGAVIGLAIPPIAAIGGRDLRTYEKVILIGIVALSAVALLAAAYNVVTFLQNPPPQVAFPGG
ncbi:MAG: rhomboid family intramembrane serine protease [Candidatus Dormibacteria bacterium]